MTLQVALQKTTQKKGATKKKREKFPVPISKHVQIRWVTRAKILLQEIIQPKNTHITLVCVWLYDDDN